MILTVQSEELDRHEKVKSSWLCCGIVWAILCSAVLTQYVPTHDEQTNTQRRVQLGNGLAYRLIGATIGVHISTIGCGR